MLPPTSADLVLKAQSLALMGIAEWLAERSDVPQHILNTLLNLLTTVPVLVGGDLGPEAELELKTKANAILTKIVGSSAF